MKHGLHGLTQINTKLFILCLFLFICYLLPAAEPDFGLALNQYGAYGNTVGNTISEENAFEYRVDIIPRYSLLFGETHSFFISGGLTIGINTALEDPFYYIPELLRTELAFRFGSFGIKAGRVPYSDPLNFIAEGLFDGLQFLHTSSFGRFSLSGFYTGFLYKKNANILMTTGDEDLYELSLDYADFSNTYFAPRRLVAILDWEHLAIGETVGIKTAIIGQFDLTNYDDSEKIDSQYINLKLEIPVKRIVFELGGSFQTSQVKEKTKNEFTTGFAAMAGINWNMPTDFLSRLSLSARYTSGESNGAFTPITAKYYSDIFQPEMSNLTMLRLSYSARFSQKIGASINAFYFIRNDLETPNTYSVVNTGEDGHLLGAEFSAKLIWSPVSDIQINLGGGAFVPALGDNWPNEKLQWRIELTAMLAIY